MSADYNHLETKALDMLNDYIREVYNRLIKKLALMVDALIDGDVDKIESELSELLKIESETIDLKNELLGLISEIIRYVYNNLSLQSPYYSHGTHILGRNKNTRDILHPNQQS